MSVECSTTNISDLPEIQLNNSCQRGTQKMRDGQMVLETNELSGMCANNEYPGWLWVIKIDRNGGDFRQTSFYEEKPVRTSFGNCVVAEKTF